MTTEQRKELDDLQNKLSEIQSRLTQLQDEGPEAAKVKESVEVEQAPVKVKRRLNFD